MKIKLPLSLAKLLLQARPPWNGFANSLTKIHIFAILFFLNAIINTVCAQSVTNIRAEPPNAQGDIVIFYDLGAPNPDLRFMVTVYYCQPNKPCNTPLKAVRGAVGIDVLRGKEKRITWNPSKEADFQYLPKDFYIEVRAIYENEPVPEPDYDQDGVPDRTDQCAKEYVKTPSGCPDQDGDGVIDKNDKCKTEYAETSDGCPKKNFPIPDMVFVEAGTFTREGGSEVTLSNFSIGKYEVTVTEFKAFIDDANYKTDAEKGDGSYVIENGSWVKKAGVSWRDGVTGKARPTTEYNHPVIHVSWNDATEYAKWLSQKTGKAYRLPTEAEWEFAAWGGKNTNGYTYSGSNTLDEVAWYDVNSYNKGATHADYGTHQVGKKKANELGIYDLSGNVWEWCEDDWHSNYTGAPTNGKAWIENPRGSSRVFRGGSWVISAVYCAVSDRYNYSPDDRDDCLGFRLCKTD